MKATGQYFPVVLFIMLYKVVLTSESGNESLKCGIQMEATEYYFPVGVVYYTVLLEKKRLEIILCFYRVMVRVKFLCFPRVI